MLTTQQAANVFVDVLGQFGHSTLLNTHSFVRRFRTMKRLSTRKRYSTMDKHGGSHFTARAVTLLADAGRIRRPKSVPSAGQSGHRLFPLHLKNMLEGSSIQSAALMTGLVLMIHTTFRPTCK